MLFDGGKKDAGVAAELRNQAGHLAGAAAGSRQVMLARVIGAIAAKLVDAIVDVQRPAQLADRSCADCHLV